jgi:hypothetical protein
MVTVLHNEWEFRAKANGEVESRNKAKGLDWALRKPSDIGYFDDHFGIIWDTLNELSHTLSGAGQELPAAEAFVSPQPPDYTQIL